MNKEKIKDHSKSKTGTVVVKHTGKSKTDYLPKSVITIMNTSLVLANNQEQLSVEQISDHVKNYGSMDIKEMLFIDKTLNDITNNEYNLIKLLNKLIEDSDESNGNILKRIRNNFEFFREILG